VKLTKLMQQVGVFGVSTKIASADCAARKSIEF